MAWKNSPSLGEQPGEEGIQNLSGMNPWDVGHGLITNLAVYGLTVPFWFCPTRPDEPQFANDWFQQTYGRVINSVDDLETYFPIYTGADGHFETAQTIRVQWQHQGNYTAFY